MRFEALDAWRGLAALMVVLVHLSVAGSFHDVPAVRNGGVAVPLFFVLSGFVVAYAYGRRLETRAQGWTFIQRRFGRLYPLHLFTLLAVFGLELIKLVMTGAGVAAGQAAFAGTNSLESLFANLVLLQAVIPFGYYGWNAPSWSISVEWACYVVFTAVCILSGRRAAAWGIGLCAAFGLLLLAHDLSGAGVHMMSGRGLLLGLFGFFTGGALLQVYRRLADRGWRGGTLAETAATGLVVGLFWFPPGSGVLLILGFASVIVVFAFQGGAISRLLLTRLPQFLGRISYSIYLVHYVVFSVVTAGVRVWQDRTGQILIRDDLIDFGPPGLMDGLAVAFVTATILVAWATYAWVEKPGRVFFNRIADKASVDQAWSATLAEVRPQPAR